MKKNNFIISVIAVICFFTTALPPCEALIFSTEGTGSAAAYLWRGNGEARIEIALSDLGLQSGDDINALSLGDDPMTFGTPRYDIFVVGPGSVGSSGDVQSRASAGKSVERDVYIEDKNSSAGNALCIEDLIGQSLGSEQTGSGTLDAFDFGDMNTEVNDRIYFSLKTGSPTLSEKGWTAGDVLTCKYKDASSLSLYAASGSLGNPTDIDALSIHDHTRDDGYDASTDYIIYSQSDNSIYHYGFGNSAGVNAVHSHASFGLTSTDNITALEHQVSYCSGESCESESSSELAGDANNDGKLGLKDILYILQVLGNVSEP